MIIAIGKSFLASEQKAANLYKNRQMVFGIYKSLKAEAKRFIKISQLLAKYDSHRKTVFRQRFLQAVNSPALKAQFRLENRHSIL